MIIKLWIVDLIVYDNKTMNRDYIHSFTVKLGHNDTWLLYVCIIIYYQINDRNTVVLVMQMFLIQHSSRSLWPLSFIRPNPWSSSSFVFLLCMLCFKCSCYVFLTEINLSIYRWPIHMGQSSCYAQTLVLKSPRRYKFSVAGSFAIYSSSSL